MESTIKRIGDGNGWMLIIFKLNLVAIPIALSALIGLNVWLVTNIFQIQNQVNLLHHRVNEWDQKGPRYSSIDAKADRLELREDILQHIQENYPPKWLRDLVDAHDKRLEALEMKLYAQ